MSESSPVYDLTALCAALQAGRLVVFPTDTVYGIGALALKPGPVRTLYAIKRRPRHLATPVMVATPDRINEVALPLPGFAELAAAFWPGPLTIILPRTAAVPDIVTAGGDTVAVRIPDHPFALDLLAAVDEPLAVTSANLSGHPPACTADEARAQLGSSPLILDGGRSPGDKPSTILDLTVDPCRVLRPGPVSVAEIAAVLGRTVQD